MCVYAGRALEAARLANIAAGLVVRKIGVATVTPGEIQVAIGPPIISDGRTASEIIALYDGQLSFSGSPLGGTRVQVSFRSPLQD